MGGRVIPYAKSIGADWYEGAPADVPPSQWVGHKADWLQAQMDQGRQITSASQVAGRIAFERASGVREPEPMLRAIASAYEEYLALAMGLEEGR